MPHHEQPISSFRRYEYFEFKVNTIANVSQANPKYMIDMETYEHLHTKAEDGEGAQRGKVHQVETVDAGLNDPPNEEFLLLLPSSILGYGFHDKRWSKTSHIYSDLVY